MSEMNFYTIHWIYNGEKPGYGSENGGDGEAKMTLGIRIWLVDHGEVTNWRRFVGRKLDFYI